MKIGRNEKCPCGSGLKFKKCHLLIEDEAIAIQKIIEDKEWQEWFSKDVEEGKQNLIAMGEKPPEST